MQPLITRCERDAHAHELAQHFAPLSHPLPHPGILGPERIQQAVEEATRFACPPPILRPWYTRINWMLAIELTALVVFWIAVVMWAIS